MSDLLNQGNIHACRQSVCLTDAETHQCFQRLAIRQAALSKAQLCEQQAALLGPRGVLSRFSRQVATQGRQAQMLTDLPELENHLREYEAAKAVDFVLGFHDRREPVENPLHGLSRQRLCCILFDDHAAYTLAERFAAGEALRQRDSLFFIKLIATTRHTVERRLVFIGLLEHFDALLPIERSIYPQDYRRAQQDHLECEERLYGRLELENTVSELLERQSPEWLLENLCPAISAVG